MLCWDAYPRSKVLHSSEDGAPAPLTPRAKAEKISGGETTPWLDSQSIRPIPTNYRVSSINEMKYRLLGELPFMRTGTVFKQASTLCCGDGWAIPAKPKAQGQTADNPVTTFNEHQNKVLDEIINDKNWITAIPETQAEKLDMYESGKWLRDEYLKAI